MSIGNYNFYSFIYIYIVVVLFLLGKMLKFTFTRLFDMLRMVIFIAKDYSRLWFLPSESFRF